jgi:hypothetical protein
MTMAKRVDIHTRELYNQAIRQNIAKKDWSKLSEVMIGAELARVGKPLKRRGWYQVGLFEAERGNHPSAIIAFNSARFAQPNDKPVLRQLFAQLEAFYEANEPVFSREDLLLFKEPIERIEGFYRLRNDKGDANLDRARKLIQRIQAKINDAPSKIETRVTHHVVRIHSALYTTMTPEEVRAEFARIIAPTVREMLKEDEASPRRANSPPRKKRKRKKKRG